MKHINTKITLWTDTYEHKNTIADKKYTTDYV